MQQPAPRPQPKSHFTRPNFLYRLFHRTTRALYRGTEFMRVNDALENVFQLGKEQGLRMQPHIVYADFCRFHPSERRELLHGEEWLAVCWRCYMESHVETPVTSPWPAVPAQNTDPTPTLSHLHTGDLMRSYRKQIKPDEAAGEVTRRYRTINLKGLQP